MTKTQVSEKHYVQRAPWLRAAVLGANDGIISTASLMLGFVSAHADSHAILLSGIAGLGAGALSMAAGEYVSVSSQHDTEMADLKREKRELAKDFTAEKNELAAIYHSRGLSMDLAQEVAKQLMAKDPLEAHAREELGISDMSQAKPLQAALASAVCFSTGAIFPILVTYLAAGERLLLTLALTSLALLAVLGFVSAKIGGSSPAKAIFRVSFWGGLAMAVTSGIGVLA